MHCDHFNCSKKNKTGSFFFKRQSAAIATDGITYNLLDSATLDIMETLEVLASITRVSSGVPRLSSNP